MSDLLRQPDALLVRNTLEVEDHLREPGSDLRLPLPQIVRLPLGQLVEGRLAGCLVGTIAPSGSSPEERRLGGLLLGG